MFSQFNIVFDSRAYIIVANIYRFHAHETFERHRCIVISTTIVHCTSRYGVFAWLFFFFFLSIFVIVTVRFRTNTNGLGYYVCTALSESAQKRKLVLRPRAANQNTPFLMLRPTASAVIHCLLMKYNVCDDIPYLDYHICFLMCRYLF